MSNTTLEWRETSRPSRKVYILTNGIQKTPIPQRKNMFSEYIALSVEDYSNVAYSKVTRGHAVAVAPISGRPTGIVRAEERDGQYPSCLVKIFTVGLVISAIGMVLLLVTFFFDNAIIKIGGAVLFALGSVTVVLTLLRGQDLDEQSV